jgi:hypothetical protein
MAFLESCALTRADTGGKAKAKTSKGRKVTHTGRRQFYYEAQNGLELEILLLSLPSEDCPCVATHCT